MEYTEENIDGLKFYHISDPNRFFLIHLQNGQVKVYNMVGEYLSSYDILSSLSYLNDKNRMWVPVELYDKQIHYEIY